MGVDSRAWALLATTGVLVGSVVLVSFVLGPDHGRARMGVSGPRPQRSGPATRRTAPPTGSGLPGGPTATPRPRPLRPAVLRRLRFRVSSFNVLGSSHTRPGGTHHGFDPGPQRARLAASLVMSHGVDVVGFQEMQADQLRSFRRATAGRYSFYPGSSLGRVDSENSLAWRTDGWRPVETRTIAIPYFGGHPRLMPYVRLRNARTGLEAWFANFHNPATTRRWGENQHWRTLATGREIRLVNRLEARTHLPVVVTGDMNERAEYFCAVAGATDLEAALGGSFDGTCRPPRIRHVDWVFGSRGVRFDGYTEDATSRLRRISDHVMVLADAEIVGRTRTVAPGARP